MNPQASLRVLCIQRIEISEQAVETQGANVVAQDERLAADVDDVQSFRLQVPQRNAHGGGEARRCGVLEFEPEAADAPNDQQVKLGPAVRGPEKALPGMRAQAGEYFPHGEAFPRGADLGMADQVAVRGEVEQAVQQAAIGEIGFGSLT